MGKKWVKEEIGKIKKFGLEIVENYIHKAYISIILIIQFNYDSTCFLSASCPLFNYANLSYPTFQNFTDTESRERNGERMSKGRNK